MSTPAVARPPEPVISPLRVFLWSLRREIWESRSIYLVPASVGVLVVIAAIINVLHLPGRLHVPSLDPGMQHEFAESPFVFAAALLMLSTMVVAVFYTVDALYGERRDRSVLFWKSMPVSDTTTVLAKLSIPTLVLPLVTFAVTFLAQVVMLLLAWLSGGLGAVSHVALLQLWWTELFHFVAYHGFWWAPFWGWFLLVSAWSRRAPLVWSVLPPLAIGFGEKIAFGTEYFGRWLMFRFAGDPSGPPPHGMNIGMLLQDGPLAFSTDIHLWTGFAMCAVCVVLAVYLRKRRGPA